MYLYEKQDNKIKIYFMKPDEQKILNYKIKEIKKIPSQERILKFVTNKPINFLEKTSLVDNVVIDLSKNDLNYEKNKFF